MTHHFLFRQRMGQELLTARPAKYFIRVNQVIKYAEVDNCDKKKKSLVLNKTITTSVSDPVLPQSHAIM